MSFGKWLVTARNDKGLTQSQLAERAGISANYISALEREEPNAKDGSPRRPRIEKVDKLARALGKPQDEARLAAGYAPATSKHIVGGYEIELPGDVASLMLYTDIKDEADLEAFKESFRIAYEITKQRIADRHKNKNDD